MKIKTLFGLLVSHGIVGAIGFALGIYLLPVLIAPAAPMVEEINALSSRANYSAVFTRDLKGSDPFHWGEGKVFVGIDTITLMGELAPGPDYRLYLSPEFVETEQQFKAIKATMVEVGAVNTFKNFIVSVPATIDPAQYTSVIVWCERFGEFITAAQYR